MGATSGVNVAPPGVSWAPVVLMGIVEMGPPAFPPSEPSSKTEVDVGAVTSSLATVVAVDTGEPPLSDAQPTRTMVNTSATSSNTWCDFNNLFPCLLSVLRFYTYPELAPKNRLKQLQPTLICISVSASRG